MASITTMLLRPTFKPSSSDMVSLTLRRSLPPTAIHFRTSRKSTTHKLFSLSVSASLQALIFDCDGVILESEHCTAKPITMRLLILTFVALIRRRSLSIRALSSTTSSRTALVAVNRKCDGNLLYALQLPKVQLFFALKVLLELIGFKILIAFLLEKKPDPSIYITASKVTNT
ncbi:hypothetical protein SDJN02_03931 [Cucurbita argyrosperma subsp. argyrosperma]|nr:hypothetical protein SDJN02_03931 [Cucurbita argyrosperma subsp. argyrosperma]